MLDKLNKIISGQLGSDQRKILINIGWLASERVFRMGVGFITLSWTARFLGVEQFGTLNFALAFVGLFSPLSKLASDQITFRDLVTDPGNKEKILGTAATIKFISGIVIFFVAICSILFLKQNEFLICKLVIIISGASLFSGFNVIETWFQSQVEVKYTIWAKNCIFILITILRIIFLQLEAPVEFFAWLVVTESLFNIIGFIFVFKITGNNIFAWRYDWHLAKELLRISFPLVFSTLAIVIYMKIDQVMLGQLSNQKSVGIYSAAVRLSEIWPFASTMIVRSLAPSIISAKKLSEENYYSKLQGLCNLQALLVYCIAIPMTFLATPFVVLIFGQEYSAAGIVLSIHIWSSMFLFLGYVKEIWITTEELTWFAFSFTAFGALMNIALNALLIPIYQEVGAALATVISYGLADYIICFVYPSARRFGLIMTQAMTLGLIRCGS
ncbi:polysaccharide biosynthesis protein [Leptolyngbya sp. Heron Island J]|uniref:flippase n=1 Tax=Leptolyngbya sp. Heron Island J TaxID=1385935 RepID=UPI0003B9782B|nr:flippase [Leptolyngbya sp. Heron Island J]ESA37260.1 polysaccharide biosynthesis protein [Leptolyngbya sp. Heron Island J]